MLSLQIMYNYSHRFDYLFVNFVLVFLDLVQVDDVILHRGQSSEFREGQSLWRCGSLED